MTQIVLNTLKILFAALVLVHFVIATPILLAQGESGGGNKGGGGNGSSSPGNNQGSQQPAGNQGSQQSANQGQSSAGITGGGSMAIESTLFAYKALALDAQKMAAAISGAVNSRAKDVSGADNSC